MLRLLETLLQHCLHVVVSEDLDVFVYFLLSLFETRSLLILLPYLIASPRLQRSSHHHLINKVTFFISQSKFSLNSCGVVSLIVIRQYLNSFLILLLDLLQSVEVCFQLKTTLDVLLNFLIER
jgi:hypothetical protein